MKKLTSFRILYSGRAYNIVFIYLNVVLYFWKGLLVVSSFETRSSVFDEATLDSLSDSLTASESISDGGGSSFSLSLYVCV